MNLSEGWRRITITAATMVGLVVAAIGGSIVLENGPASWPVVPAPLRFRCPDGSVKVVPQEEIQALRRSGCNAEPGQTFIVWERRVPVENLQRVTPDEEIAIKSQQQISEDRDRKVNGFYLGLQIAFIGGPGAALAVLAAARLLKWIVAGFASAK